MKRLFLLLVIACGVPEPIDEPQPVAPVLPSTDRAAQQPRQMVLGAPGDRVLRDQTTWIALQLDETTVFCSELGYGASFLKVSVPDLDWLAHFSHKVDELGLPCAAAGACSDSLNPETILQSNPGVERVAVRVVLIEHLELNATAHSCTRTLEEFVTLEVRGVPLQHHVSGDPEVVSYAVCAALAAN